MKPVLCMGAIQLLDLITQLYDNSLNPYHNAMGKRDFFFSQLHEVAHLSPMYNISVPFTPFLNSN